LIALAALGALRDETVSGYAEAETCVLRSINNGDIATARARR
jgi:hypothetical protein